jgi:GNAT superfamily N-acetyltransferase
MDIVLRDVVHADASTLAHVLITANEDAFRGRVPDQCLESSEAESAANWRHTLSEELPADDFMIVAQTLDGEVVGYTWGGPNTKDAPYMGELRQLSVLPAYQGHGIGRRLVCEVARRLGEQGIYSMMVEVLRVNPNRAFYERLGGVFVSEHPCDWDGIQLFMCVYGWEDTSTFLSDHCR